MKPLSNDLRKKFVDAVLVEGMTCRAAGERFAVSHSAVIKIVKQFIETGFLDPQKVGGSRKPILSQCYDMVRAIVDETPDLTLAQIAGAIVARGGPKVTRRWAARGTRPFALKDQRTASAYIFGAICPALGKATGLVLPFCNTEAMELHLQEIALAVQPGAHAVLFADQAGWHVTAKLKLLENMTLVPLPSKSPELNPVENIWQYMRDNWLSNRIFKSYDDIVDHCCFNWNKLVERPWLITSIGMRTWAHGSTF
jgi:transposase